MSVVEALTRDNSLLSRPTIDSPETLQPAAGSGIAINCTELAAKVAGFVQASLAPNTRLAYAADLAAFRAWGGTLPASPELVAAYLADHADTLASTTLLRRLASISKAHTARQWPNPVATELVRATMRGIRRTRKRPSRAAKPLLRDDLFSVLDTIGSASVRDCRDRALLLLGFAGGFRRSELVGLDVEDLTWRPQGIVVNLRRSKTDQTAEGRPVGVPHGAGRHCPVKTLERWLAVSGTGHGPVFRPINRHGVIRAERLSAEAVSLTIKQRAAEAGFDPTGFSGHSLRAGFVTSAAMAGVPTWKIRMQTGHASDVSLSPYIRGTDLFVWSGVRELL